MDNKLTIVRATQKIADALGMDKHDTADALSADETEAALMVEEGRYKRELADLQTEFMHRRGVAQREHLKRVAEISGGQ